MKQEEVREEVAIARAALAEVGQLESKSRHAKKQEIEVRLSDLRAGAIDAFNLENSRNVLKMHARKISYSRYVRFLYWQ